MDDVSELYAAYAQLRAAQDAVASWLPPYGLSNVHVLIQTLSEVLERLSKLHEESTDGSIRLPLYEMTRAAGRRSESNLIALGECAHVLEAQLSDSRVSAPQSATQVNELKHRMSQVLIVMEQVMRQHRGVIIDQPPQDLRWTGKSQPNGDVLVRGENCRVFLSSTWQDLQVEREAVEKALHRMRDAAFAGMEYFGSRSETPREVSLAEVDRSDIYVGIFAHRYGSGITEDEYRRAKQRQIPCLIYMKDDTVPVIPAHVERDPEKVKKLETLKDELKRNHTISLFKTADDLAAKVVADLHNQLRNTAGSQPASPTQTGPKYQISIGTAQGVVIGDGAQVTQHFGTESKVVPAHMAAAASQQRRCEDLAENIKEILELIKQYEDQRRLADDPKAKRRAEREITELRRQLQECETERKTLECE